MPRIGTSELDIFPLSLGANVFGWTADKVESEKVLDAFVEGGGNFIDTADGYSYWAPGNSGGESESIVGDWTHSRSNRDGVVIATKVSTHPDFKGLSAANIADAANASLNRLKTDYIDLYYAHFDDEETPLLETVAAFNQLVQMGKVRYVGISNYTPQRISEWLKIAKDNGFALPVALQPHYNLVHRADFEREMAPLAEAHNLGVFPYWSLASGFLTGKYRSAADLEGAARASGTSAYVTTEGLKVIDALDSVASARGISITTTALAWLLAKPTITAPLASARTVSQLPDLLAVADVQLTAEEIAALDEASQSFS
jgi:aryl-alcohol dehydrogenase-like predicted oxidoreductase